MLVGLFVLLAAATAGLGSTTSEAMATPFQDNDSGSARVGEPTLVFQSSFVEPDGVFVMDIDLGELQPPAQPEPSEEEEGDDAAVDEATGEAAEPVDVVVTIYGRIDDGQQLDEEPADPINRLPTLTLDDYTIDAQGVMSIRMPVRQGQAFDDVDRIRLREPGVFPVTVEFRTGAETLGMLRTNLVHLGHQDEGDDGSDATPLTASVVLDLLDPDSVTVADAAELLAEHPSLDATLVIGESHLSELHRDPALTATLRSAMGVRPVVVVAEPDLDPSSLATVDQIELYRRSVELRRATLNELGLVADTSIVTLGESQTRDGATALAELGIETAIDVRSLKNPTETDSVRFETTSGRLLVVAADATSALLGGSGGYLGDDDAVGRTHRLLAMLSLADAERGPTILNAGASSESDLATLRLAFDALGHEAVAVLPLDGAVPLLAAAEAPDLPRPANDFSDLSESIERAQDRLNTYETFYLDGANPPARYRDDIDAALGQGLTFDKRTEIVDALNEQLGAELAVISLPENQSVTLAARSAPIPLTIENDSKGTRQILLQFLSDKIVVEEDGELITVESGTSSIDIQVEARSLGASPLQVLVLSPDGKQTLATTRFQVRSTAVPGLGLLISAVGLILLGVWWYLSIRRRHAAKPDNSGHPRSGPSPRGDADDRDPALAGDSV